MLADIEAGKVATVIVKDMSRLGRNYLQVGMYTEMIFPQKGVRFIAINDGVDLSLIHILLIATAIVVFVWVRSFSDKS